MTINKETKLPKFPLFNPSNLQKFFEDCLQAYRRYWSESLIIHNPEGIISYIESDFKERDKQNVERVLKETDHKEVASLIGSYARLITKNIYSFRFVTNCWCCIGVQNDFWGCEIRGDINSKHKETPCPASLYCYPLASWLNSYSYKVPLDFNIKDNLAKNIVLSRCNRHGFTQVWRFLPDVKDAQVTEAHLKADLFC